jgi:ribonuclease HI
MKTQKIEIYTDGSCLGNPGPGGWGAMIINDGEKIKISGGEKDTTNNRMEMTAIIKALEWFHEKSGLKREELTSCKIILHSDSNLLMQTLIQGWKRKANTDLWAEIDKLRAWLNIEWVWVKAHSENHYNNEIDALAFNEAQKQKAENLKK